jgi:hypothetical protein
MKSSSTSFTSFSDSKISSTLGSVGVSLGRTSEEISVSANVLRHLEYDRIMVTSTKLVRCYGMVSIKYLSIKNPIQKPNNSRAHLEIIGMFPSPSLPTPRNYGQ